MKIKTLLKLTTLGEYLSIRYSNDKHYFFKIRSVGKMHWDAAMKYKPLDSHELNAIRSSILNLDDSVVSQIWLASEVSKITAKVFSNWSNGTLVAFKVDKYDVHPVYRFNLTNTHQCGIV